MRSRSAHPGKQNTPYKMTSQPSAVAQLIFTRMTHTIRTVTVRDDLIGWVRSGKKRLCTPHGETQFTPGQVFLIPRATHWDVINEAPPGGHYQADIISFTPRLLETFFERFGQFAAMAAVQGNGRTHADAAFASTFEHAVSALGDSGASHAVRDHRALEVLLLLAERGLVFAPASELTWSDRVYRLVAQRPHATWSVKDVAHAFHTSTSTLRRRLAEEGTAVSRCVRDVRLEAAMALLQGSNLQVSEIATRCGYDSHSRFSAAFRQRFGYAPSHLRTGLDGSCAVAHNS